MAQCPCSSAGVGAQAAAAKAAAKLGESPSVAQIPPVSPAGSCSLPSLPAPGTLAVSPCPRGGRWVTVLSPAAGAGVLPGVGGIPGVAPGVGVGGVPGVGGEAMRGLCPRARGGSPPLIPHPDCLPLSRQSEDRQQQQQQQRRRQRQELLVSSCCLGQISGQGRAVHRCQGLCGTTVAPAAPIPSSGVLSLPPVPAPAAFPAVMKGWWAPRDAAAWHGAEHAHHMWSLHEMWDCCARCQRGGW